VLIDVAEDVDENVAEGAADGAAGAATDAAARVVEAAARALGLPAPAIVQCRAIEDGDWVRRTQEQFAPITIGRLCIVPSWHEPPDATAVVIRLDPGAAFGTGSHPTTRLCLQWLVENLAAGARVLDYGCGSGILSIAAARLGAGEVLGVDIDPQALEVARSNAAANGISARYTSPAQLAADGARRFDLVLANILANPLMVLAPSLVARVDHGGSLLLSGILARQADEVVAAYRQARPDLRLQVWRSEEEWVAIAGTLEN
jgi:ribosomal protein L11 methyltransferase